MATIDPKANAKEMSVEERLQALYDLQKVGSAIDKIRTLRGELPLEVQDLEDEIEGLVTRMHNMDAEVKKLSDSILAKKNEIKESDLLIKKYEAQLLNVKSIEEKDKVSTTTLKKYLKWTRRFYKFAYASRFIDVDIASFLESPKAELSAQMEREPFEVEEVKKSFKIIEDVLTDDNLKLVYKILAYTGMRISELSKGQLNKDGEIFYIDLTEESCSLKTKSSHRKIPLHKDLILLDVHKKYNQLRGLFRDEYISKKFREQVKPHLTNNPRKTLYSYRHTLATQLKYAEVNPIVISEILGHSHEGMTMGRYASRYPLEVLKEAIDRLEF